MPDLLIELFSEEIPARMQTRAADDLKKLVTLLPKYTQAYLKLGNTDYELYNYQEARRAYQNGLDVDPGNKELQEKLKLVEDEGDLIMNPHFNPDVMKKLEESQYFSKYYSTIPEFREQFD